MGDFDFYIGILISFFSIVVIYLSRTIINDIKQSNDMERVIILLHLTNFIICILLLILLCSDLILYLFGKF